MDAAAVAWPLGAHGQQPAMPVIGFLHGGSPEPSVNPVAAFRKGLAEAGHVEGQNVAIEFRWAAGHGSYGAASRLLARADEVIE
jgi:putative tryptophan/tyrosine transport system substrate-binding protein